MESARLYHVCSKADAITSQLDQIDKQGTSNAPPWLDKYGMGATDDGVVVVVVMVVVCVWGRQRGSSCMCGIGSALCLPPPAAARPI